LQLLLLLRVSLLQLLRLLLMPLLQLLRSGFISVPLLHLLVLLLLLLLEFLVFLILPGDQLFLLLLVFLVPLGIPRVRRSGRAVRGEISSVGCTAGPWNIIIRTRSPSIGARLSCGTIGRRIIRRPRLFGRYDFAPAERSRFLRRSDWRFAVVRGCS
jgi:hypothetical protein